MKMNKILFALLISIACCVSEAGAILVNKIPFCNARPFVFRDLDGDGLPETICMRSNNQSKKNGNIYGVYINFTRHRVSHQFSMELFTDSKKLVNPNSDDEIDVVQLRDYKDRLPNRKLPKLALRLIHPEKSSVIFYWNEEGRKVEEFWETD
jgi:hypothetical protein